MLPRLQIAIRRQEFVDFPTLEDLAMQLEQSYIAEKNYRLPKQSIFPDLVPPQKEKRRNRLLSLLSPLPKKENRTNANVNLRDFVKSTATAADPALPANPSTTAVAAASSTLK